MAEDEPAYDQPLKVTGLMEGDTVQFYQVLEWVGEADGNVAIAGRIFQGV